MKTQNEQWKAIADSNGEYHISDYGRVKSYKCGKERILKPGLRGKLSSQYLGVVIQNKTISIHRLVALAFIPNSDNKPHVNHKDGNKLNNHIDNLEWMTSKENIQHAWCTGLCENDRLRRIKSQSKPVVDIVTGNKYESLKFACEDINEPYGRHQVRAYIKSPLQRFFFVN